MNGSTDLPKLKEADALISAEVERLLIENKVWHFNAYGWQNAYDADSDEVARV
jgi:hypothetical protein